MYSQRRSKAMSIPESPIYPVIKKVDKKPIKTKAIEYVDVADILTQHQYDEASLADMITPVNRGALTAPKKSYTPKVNKNFRPDTKLLHTLERSIQNQPREYTSVKVGNAAAAENIGTHHTDIQQLLQGSGKLKNKRTTYKPREEFSISVNNNFSQVLNLPSDNEVLPNLKETMPHPSVPVSNQYAWQAQQKDPQLKLKQKYPDVPSTTSTTEVPFNKPLDVVELNRQRKYKASLRYEPTKEVDYQKQISSAVENLELTQKYDTLQAYSGTDVPYEKPMEWREIDLPDNKQLQPTRAMQNLPYEKSMDIREHELYQQTILQPNNATSTVPFEKSMDIREHELHQQTALQPNNATSTVPFEKSMDIREYNLQQQTALQPNNATSNVPYEKSMDIREHDLQHQSALQPTSSVKQVPFEKSMDNRNVNLAQRSILKPATSKSQVPYEKPMDNRNVYLDKPTIYTPRYAQKQMPYEKRQFQNPSVHVQDKRPTTSTAPGHSGGYATQEQIENQWQSAQRESAYLMQRQQQKPQAEYSFDSTGRNRRGYFPAGSVPTTSMNPQGFSKSM